MQRKRTTDSRHEDESLFCHDLPTRPRADIGRVLVTGASGYVGGRLVPELIARGYRVRVLVRKASPEQKCLWPDAEIVEADALRPESMREALRDIDTAYYLIHSLLLGPDRFSSADTEAAVNFRIAADENRVKRIIYLGGLGDLNTSLSSHLRSRMQVAEKLREGRTPVTVLRAAVIIGSGSASYEIIHHIVRKLPLLPTPYWIDHRCQPIGIRDVIKYLVGIMEIPETAGLSFDIGGRDVLTYMMMLRTLAQVLHKRTVFVSSPIPSIGLYAYLSSLVTPVPAPLIRCLYGGLKNDVVCQGDEIRGYLPFEPLTFKEMIVGAMTREEQDRVYTRWTDSYPPAHELALKLHEIGEKPRFAASYSLATEAEARALYESFCKVGGKEGWFHNNWMWRARGMVDRLLLGVGSSRGRRSYATVKTNDVIDFWRVEDLKPNERLLLRAEMRLPGRAWLEFDIHPILNRNVLSVNAYYDTKTVWGTIYWYLFLPFHSIIFNDLIRQIEKRAEPALR